MVTKTHEGTQTSNIYGFKPSRNKIQPRRNFRRIIEIATLVPQITRHNTVTDSTKPATAL